MLLKESPTEIDLVSQIFYLSQNEKQLLLSAGVGEGLFFAGLNHVAMRVLAAPFEHELITSNPEEVLRQRQKEAIMDPLAQNQASQNETQQIQFSQPNEAPQQNTQEQNPNQDNNKT